MSKKMSIQPGMIGYLSVAVDQHGIRPYPVIVLDVLGGCVTFITNRCTLSRVTLESDHAMRSFKEDEDADIGTLRNLLDARAALVDEKIDYDGDNGVTDEEMEQDDFEKEFAELEAAEKEQG